MNYEGLKGPCNFQYQYKWTLDADSCPKFFLEGFFYKIHLNLKPTSVSHFLTFILDLKCHCVRRLLGMFTDM